MPGNRTIAFNGLLSIAFLLSACDWNVGGVEGRIDYHLHGLSSAAVRTPDAGAAVVIDNREGFKIGFAGHIQHTYRVNGGFRIFGERERAHQKP